MCLDTASKDAGLDHRPQYPWRRPHASMRLMMKDSTSTPCRDGTVSDEGEAKCTHPTTRELCRTYIRDLSTSSRCDQSKPACFPTPIFESPDQNHCRKGVNRLGVPHLHRDHALFLRAWQEEEEPQSCLEVNGFECVNKPTDQQGLSSRLWETFA
jgi:hypothetical protein